MTLTSPDTTAVGSRPVAPSRGVLRPLGLGEVRVTGGFWARRQEVNASATLPHIRSWLDRLGWTGNFTAGTSSPDRRGREFSDSEVYKLLEAMCWESGRAPDPVLEAGITELTGMIAAAQAPDGYVGTAFGGTEQRSRYSDLAWGHELYCAGHLIQAAVARARTTGPDLLLEVARSLADHVCAEFGPDGRQDVCGHPEIEVALVELSRVTGEERYLRQAALFVERRGHRTLPPHEFGWSYFSDDTPVLESTALHGHAVRALYLASGAVDVAVDTGDDDLLRAIAAQFDHALARRTYITGGMGSRHTDEAFGDDFALPADRAYSETCAGVAAVMLAWRLLLATGDGRYDDVVERVLHNVVATAIGDDGRSFFYANTLHQRTPTALLPDDQEQLGFGGGPRAPWFEVSCCLPNSARLLASLACYAATVDETGVRLHQYVDAEIDTHLADGREVGLRVSTAYPDDGVVTVRVVKTDDQPWSITLRVPQWAEGAVLETRNGRNRAPVGTVVVYRTFEEGEELRLELPMRPRFTAPDPRIDAVRGCVAVERGPLVYCAESTREDLDTVRVDPFTAPVDGPGGVVVRARFDAPAGLPWPYGSGSVGAGPYTPYTLVPYHRWARGGPSTMRVWLPSG